MAGVNDDIAAIDEEESGSMSDNSKVHVNGLDDVIAATTELSHVFGSDGKLVYRGYDINELANKASFEEVAHLLWKGHLPNKDELAEMERIFGENRELPEPVIEGLRQIPASANPMDALRTGVSLLGAVNEDKFNDLPTFEEAIELAARFPAIAAAFHRLRNGKEPIQGRSDLNTAQNFLYMMTGEEPAENHWKPLDTYLVLLADHGLNASTFTARVITSTNSDMASALTGAIGALKGPAHGGAPAKVLEMLEEIGSAENVDAYLTKALDEGKRLMGFGHRVYKAEDPRAEILREMAREASTPEFFALSKETEDKAIALLEERKPGRKLYTNVEFYSAAVLAAVGLPGDMFPVAFAVSRSVGWSAHVLEQVEHNRLIRPASEYVGPVPTKTFAPIGDR
ncbi:MAG TPA: citrate/2-methylcitrate synthase [Thermomicrobiales bacterium]|jgi:citrate synthase|nr:citrate/2-methylcitrate synthase [Thermomicrobiales bacterium]